MSKFDPSRRQVVRGVVCGTALLGSTSLFAGCAMQSAYDEQAALPDEIRIRGADGYGLDRVLAAFNEANGVMVTAERTATDADTVKRLQAGDVEQLDVVSVGHVSARHDLHAQGLIRPLDHARFEAAFAGMLPAFQPPFRWAMSLDESALIGIPQRFDLLSLVVNTDKVSLQTAEEQGFALFNDDANAGRFGILTDDIWNIAHMCVGVGVDPFKRPSHDDIVALEKCARKWFRHAALLSHDPAHLNQALVAGDIDFYCSGGIASAAPARMEGHANVRAVIPASGPIDGSAGIARVELLCIVDNSRAGEVAAAFCRVCPAARSRPRRVARQRCAAPRVPARTRGRACALQQGRARCPAVGHLGGGHGAGRVRGAEPGLRGDGRRLLVGAARALDTAAALPAHLPHVARGGLWGGADSPSLAPADESFG